MWNRAIRQLYIQNSFKIDPKSVVSKYTVLEIRAIFQYFTDQFWVNTGSFSKQSVPNQDTDQNFQSWSVFRHGKYRIKCIIKFHRSR